MPFYRLRFRSIAQRRWAQNLTREQLAEQMRIQQNRLKEAGQVLAGLSHDSDVV